MSEEIKIDYNELNKASDKLKLISNLIREAERLYINAGKSFEEDYEGQGKIAYGTFLKSLVENMDKLVSCYRITGESIQFAVEEFKTFDMNEAEKIRRDFEANRSHNTWKGEQSYPKGPVKSAI